MFNPALHPPAPSAPSGLSERLTLIVGALSRAAAARAARNWAAAPLVLLLWPYLQRLARRFEALSARFQTGRMVARSARPQTARAPSVRPASLPHGFAWLLRLVPEAVCLRGQLQHLLADPEMAALIATTPQAGRMLRPLCRMLGLSPGAELPAALFRPPVAPQSARPPGRAVDERGRPPPHAGPAAAHGRPHPIRPRGSDPPAAAGTGVPRGAPAPAAPGPPPRPPERPA